MARTNDNSADPKDWTNRKLIAVTREGLSNIAADWQVGLAVSALNELQRRVVRSSSAG